MVFKTESDTEVLANALQVWGYRALERFVGMYGFVALDLATGEFLAARDPFGVRELTFYDTRVVRIEKARYLDTDSADLVFRTALLSAPFSPGQVFLSKMLVSF